MTIHNLTKKSKASTGQIITPLVGPDLNSEMRLSILEKKMDKLIETLTKKDD